MIYTVTLELHSPEKNDALIRESIKKFGRWAEPVRSTYLIDVDIDADKLRDFFRPYLLAQDKVFVIEVTKRWSSYRLSKSVAVWLKQKTRSWPK